MSQEQIQIPKGWKEDILEDVMEIIPVTGKKIKNQDFKPTGKLAIIDQGNKLIGGYTDDLNCKIEIDSPVIVFGDHTRVIKYIDFDFAPGADGTKVLKPDDRFNPKYFYYFLHSIKLQNRGYSRHFKILKSSTIIYPPIPIQKKIVQKLDDILGQLDEKKKAVFSIIDQNKEKIDFFEKNWWRYLITNEIEKHPQRKEWELRKLSDVTISHDGKRVPLNKSQRSQIQGDFPYYGASGQVDSINDYKFDGKFMLLAEDGENLNSRKKPIAFIVEGKFWVNNHAHVLEPNDEILIEYLCYYVNSLNIMSFAKEQSTRPKLNKSDMNEIPIPLPPLPIQKQIIQNIKNAEEKFKSQKSQFENIKENYENSITYVNHIQSSILDAAFSGKLVN